MRTNPQNFKYAIVAQKEGFLNSGTNILDLGTGVIKITNEGVSAWNAALTSI
jgi:hypothetical protein